MTESIQKEKVLKAQGLTKTWKEIGASISVLAQLDLTVFEAEAVGILGVSGSGKSTLLHVLGGLEQADSGEVFVMGQSWKRLNETQKAAWRNQHVGFVYQMHHLLPELSALENVMLPLMIFNSHQTGPTHRLLPSAIEEEANQWLNRVGLAKRSSHRPAELSGGERQRVSIARALIMKPRIIFADEPTGNLDRSTAHQMIDLFLSLREWSKSAVVLVTHDLEIAKRLDRCLTLVDGRLI